MNEDQRYQEELRKLEGAYRGKALGDPEGRAKIARLIDDTIEDRSRAAAHRLRQKRARSSEK